MQRPRHWKNYKANSVFHILIRGEAIMRLSRLVRETLDKLPFPEDVAVTVDVDPYQLL
jgi:primosomal protein N'